MYLSTLDFLIIAASAWRLAYMLVNESGPYDMFDRLRKWNTFGGLLECIYCTSIWTAAIMWLVYLTVARPVSIIFAASAIGLAISSYTGVGYER